MALPVFPTLPGLTYTTLKSPAFSTLNASSPNGYEVRLPQSTNPIWSWTMIFDFLHDYFWGSFTTVSELRTLMGFFNAQYGSMASFLYTDPDDNYVGPALVPIALTPNTPLAQLALVTDGAGHWFSPVQRTLDGVYYEDITDLNGAIAVYANGSAAGVGGGQGQYQVAGPGLAIPGYSYMGMYLAWGNAFGSNIWQPSISYSLGYSFIDPNGYVQKVTTAGGPSGLVEPIFNSVGTTTDGSVVWTSQGYNPAPASPITAQFNFYFRVRFDDDSLDFEKFAGAGTTGQSVAGQGGGWWTIGGSESVNGKGTLKLRTARPVPL